MKELMTAKMEIYVDAETFHEIAIEGYVNYSVDRNYGADADGNRGSVLKEVDDVTNLSAYNEDGDYVELNESQKDRACEILTRSFLES